MNKTIIKNAVRNLFGLLLLSTVSYADNFDIDQFKIKDTNAAIEVALDYTGFDMCESFSIEKSVGKIELLAAKDSTTPFLHQKINGSIAWLIEFRNIMPIQENMHGKNANDFSRDFYIYLDAESGILLKICSPSKGSEIMRLLETSVQQAEEKIRRSAEIYVDFCDSIPPVSFYEALNTKFIGAPFFAKEIRALYVLNSRLGKQPKPVWVIRLMEPPAMPMDSDRRYDHQGEFSRSARSLIDAVSGEVIIVKRTVLPIRPDEKD